jgi:hypothetical protein
MYHSFLAAPHSPTGLTPTEQPDSQRPAIPYRGTSLTTDCNPLRPYTRPSSTVVLGGGAALYERGTPVVLPPFPLAF